MQIAQRVWLEVSKKCDVVFVLELVTETQSIKGDHLGGFILVFIAWYTVFVKFIIGSALTNLGAQLVFVVADLLATAFPLIGASFSVTLSRINKWFHSYLEAGFVLLKIAYIELVLSALPNISNRKVEPLGVGR